MGIYYFNAIFLVYRSCGTTGVGGIDSDCNLRHTLVAVVFLPDSLLHPQSQDLLQRTAETDLEKKGTYIHRVKSISIGNKIDFTKLQSNGFPDQERNLSPENITSNRFLPSVA